MINTGWTGGTNESRKRQKDRERAREIEEGTKRAAFLANSASYRGWRHRLDIIRFNSLNFAKIANLLRCALLSSSFVSARRLLWISRLSLSLVSPSSLSRSIYRSRCILVFSRFRHFVLFIWMHYTGFVLLALP